MTSARSTTYSGRYEDKYPWAAADSTDPGSARCNWCNRSFKINSMGRGAFESHQKSKGHQREISIRRTNLQIKNFSTLTTPASNEGASSFVRSERKDEGVPSAENSAPSIHFVSTSSEPSKQQQSSGSSGVLQKYLLKEQVITAEIIWALETIFTHSSYRGAGADAKVFRRMFPDSEIAARMELGRTKIGYLITYGIAPYITNELLHTLQECEEFVVGFDETLNKIVQRQQMDIGVRFWNPKSNKVEARYLGSAFLSSTRSNDLINGMKQCFSANPALLKKIAQCSMDGPAVNWKAFKELTEEIKDLRASPSFEVLNIGSCGLHVVHNSFKEGLKQTDWHVDNFLPALFSLFKNVPLRRADYTAVTGSTIFPLKFCEIRWVENEQVAKRALQMLPHLRKFVDAVRKQEESKLKDSHPNFKRSFPSVFRSKVFMIVADAVDDKMLGPKLNFVITSAAMVESFLREYQTESPMAPFLFDDLTGLVRAALEKIVKPERLTVKAKSLIEIELTESNLLPVLNVEIGFATKSAIKKAREFAKITDKDVLSFRKDCQSFYCGFLKKLLKKSPLTYPVTRYITCLNPDVITNFADVAKKRLVLCLETLVDKGHLSGSVADKAKTEFEQLCAMPSSKTLLAGFQRQEQRLDTFWVDLISQSKRELSNLTILIKKVLILSHGNATMERGFSINDKCLVVNQTEKSLVAQRTVYDAITTAGTVNDVQITKSLVQYARNARAKYGESLAAQKNEADLEEKAKQTKREAERKAKELEAKKIRLLADAQRDAACIDEQIKLLKK